MYTRIKEYIEEYKMLEGIKNVVVGFSGGADSVCLLLMLKTYIEDTGLDIGLTAVHVNHGIRGDEANRDETFCRELCENENIYFEAYHYDVPFLAEEAHISEEEMGRKLRYEAFCGEAEKLGADSAVIAVAHHENDQAETVLFNLVRGTGLKGACAMKPVSDVNGIKLIRPLLCVKRKEIELCLDFWSRDYVTDSTNLSTVYSRNKIRHHVLEYMERELNPDAVSNICSFSQKLLLVSDYMDDVVDKAYTKYITLCKGADGDILVDGRIFDEHKAVSSLVIHRLLFALNKKDITEANIDGIIELFGLQTGRRISLPGGFVAIKEYENILITRLQDSVKKNEKVPALNVKVMLKPEKISFSDYTKVFDYGKIRQYLHMDSSDIVVRTRMDDDYFYVDNDGHTKKLNQYFIDQKVPGSNRDAIYVAALGNLVLWIIGMRDTAFFRVSEETKEVLTLSLEDKNM